MSFFYECAVILPVYAALFFVFFFSIMIEKKKFMRELQKEIHKAEIIKKLVTVGNRANEISESLRDYPNIGSYIAQINLFFDKYGFNFDEMQVSTLDKASDQALGFSKYGFYDELIRAEKKIVNVVASCSEVLGNIFQIKNPVKYWMITLKKNILLRILHILVVFLRKKPQNNEVLNKAKEKTAGYNFVGRSATAPAMP